MDILNKTKESRVNKPEVEHVVREQAEYSILGTYLITKGFRLFAYSSITGKIRQVKIKKGEFIQCELIKFPNGNPSGEWVWFDPENSNVTIDSKETYFEALNLTSAKNRVLKMKNGKVKELFNLKKPNNSTIDFF